jgi:hypothetical protein
MSEPSASTQPSSQAAVGPVSLQNTSGQYDYTKRKRWGDLISSEVVETVAFVVNSSLTVLLCGAAICELLGWRDADFLDTELTEYMDGMALVFEKSVPESN